ncbi:fat-like cadherin-related tumor suppressor homolog isoform X3 [Schistocerca gregaria]|uniref:fat-like cadherin-related tumor suppressor homolog isoform X3 n=1 Tax=Schistocerca gregaria TaxID=7010 RepID=UPI00211E9945|nr:fat-like cadherin-related tumor suppressor homolog isoform X3 [Schistocerca gregaria]
MDAAASPRARRLQLLLLLLVSAAPAGGPAPAPASNPSAGPDAPRPSPPPPPPPGAFRFTRPAYNASIPENSPPKTYATPEERMGVVTAPDDPREADAVIRFKIVAGDRDKFFKAEEKLVGDFCFLLLRTRTDKLDVLNRERKDRYVLDVRATKSWRGNSSATPLIADTRVAVTVLDTNDLNPLFYPTEYEVTVPEDTPLHRSIAQVSAEDADLGRNGEIYYSFLDATDQFSVHPMTGVVSLTRPLRYTAKSVHELTVKAQDRSSILKHGPQAKASTATLKVRVQQVNLFAPEIYVRHLPDIAEHSNADIYAIVRVTDRDKGMHGEIKSLDIVDGDPDGHFRIKPAGKPGEYNIVVVHLLDRETAPQGYNLTLKATDMGIPPKETYKSVPVHLTDLNDNAPVFDREIYEVEVPETAPVNTPVIRLKVTDADEGKNAQVFLEIVGGNEGGEFRINPDTGMLYTAVQLDAEEKAMYTLTVSAIDQGNAGTRKQSSAKVKVTVADTNDNDPLFETPEATVWVDENEPAGTTVTKVSAKDRDSGENAYISYSIANLKPVPFEIDHFSGVVKTTMVLDYESMRREYILRIRASDWGLPYRRQTEMQLKINVRDINDNRPQFEKVDCSGHVPRYVPIGTEIITLSAIDFDAGSIISYRLVGGNADSCFGLDATSGVLSVTCDLTDVKVSEREVNITATDGTHFSDIVHVLINLVNAKRSLGSPGRILTDETGAFECRDTGVTHRLTEILAAGERNNAPYDLHREDFAMMPSRYGENVHTPEFLDFPTGIKVNESVALGTTLVKLRARDRDLGYNGKLVYGISDGDYDSVFLIDPETGELKVVGHLDREREAEYLLNISVYDLGRPQKAASRFLPVTVLDVNDNAPRFEKAVASFRVTENALNGTAIFRVNATDADQGENARVLYSLVTDTDDFAVDARAGVLTVAAALDRERQDVYELKVRATDGGGGGGGDVPPLSSDAIVRILIDDVNDNAPAFALPSYTVKAREDLPVGSVVAVVGASDPDVGAGGQVQYSLVGGAGDGDEAFSVDRLSGAVRTAAPLDFEERQVHTLVVRARDRGAPPLSSSTTVVVEVVDVNENVHAPQFGEFVWAAAVLENQPAGTLVTAVRATDADPRGDDSRVSYSIRGGDGVGLFTVDDEGNIRTTAPLDVESKPRYWLTVFAQDHGVVPLHSQLEVLVEVLNQNDNTPMTTEPVYYPQMAEGSPPGTPVLRITASDHDRDPSQKLSFRISAGNPDNLFVIDSDTGVIKTTSRRLDRETMAEHILEVTVSDNGTPPLSSTTQVVVIVTDINDHAPEFTERTLYKVTIPESAGKDIPLFQNETEELDVAVDSFLENGTWETYDSDIYLGEPMLRVLGFDEDEGPNADLQYSIKSGRGIGKFKIHPKTGIVYSSRDFQAGQEYDLRIRAQDSGQPPRSHTMRVSVLVEPVPTESPNAPQIINPNQHVQVTESDPVGFLVALIQAKDEDGDMLWYSIEDGDDMDEFFIGRDKGNVLLAKKLDWERKNTYNLTISVTDGVHTTFTQLYVNVIDINDHRPEFTEKLYSVEISENVEKGTEILRLIATDKDEDKRVIYSLHAARNPVSLSVFKVDSITGSVTLNEKLDRETVEEHVLTVMVRDQGTPSKRNYARVIVTVHDHNDHPPEFTSQLIQGKVFETSSIGTAVVQVYAIDRDRGENAKIKYSITSGNIGNVFSIDPSLGIVHVARELDIGVMSEYMLVVKATDHGSPSLSATIPVHIMVTMADNAPPRFLKQEHAAEIYENQPVGTYVKHLEARSTSSLFYEIKSGNKDDMFFINPSTGVIITKRQLDYEFCKFYNLTIEATNMAGAKTQCSVIVHVLDKNDNAPTFLQPLYQGVISEGTSIGSLVLTNNTSPLVITARDDDSELNGLLNYDIIEALPRKFFHIDSSTGAIRTVLNLDHETIPEFHFHVKVSDLGKPQLYSENTATVEISVTDVNDCPPHFTQTEYNATLLLPTYQNVAVVQVVAADPDSAESTHLRYDIIDGNRGEVFAVDSDTGVITVSDATHIRQFHRLHLRVSDGKFSSVAQVNIKVEQSEKSGLKFQKDVYLGTIIENSTKVMTVAVVNVLGSALNEHIVFNILNPTDMFEIGSTSGAIRTTGKRFDRELKDKYELIVEARSDQPGQEQPRVAHVMVNVTILDINDNCPMFVNLPYYAVVSVDAQKGDSITKVHAVDLDKGENGEVRYELIKGHGELFKVCRKSGEITLKQSLEGHNREYELVIAAYDGGITPCSTEMPVHIKVIDRSMPVFDKQFYTDSVLESIELHSSLAVSIQAESPLGRKLIYSIVKGNEYEEFALDFNTGVIYVVDELDYEQKKQYELTIRATDSVSGVYAEVPVSILVQDVNDCPPEFSSDSYNISVSEASPFGTSVLRVSARDNDTGINQKIRYQIQSDSSNSSEFFHIDSDDGSIYLKQSLDHEIHDSHHFTIIAMDAGVPSLSSTAHVWVSVIDMNDNPPKFEQPSYVCSLSEHAQRGQFITVVKASDPDYVDHERLSYTIVGGNEQQTFSIDSATGVISLINMQNFAEKQESILNISVTDGVYTSFTRVRIIILPANRHNPAFPKIQFEVTVPENQPRGTLVTKVTATDKDFGKYGEVAYSIPSDLLKEIFEVNKKTGEIFTKRSLDREEQKLYELPVMATDGGGRSGFIIVRVKVGDLNDNAPSFLLREYKATIPGNLTLKSPFLKVKAVDRDDDMAAEIEYSIYETQGSETKELFSIDKHKGTISLAKNATSWENEVFQFFVRAQDRGVPSLYADVPVDVFIMGSQDVAPMFERKDDNFFLQESSPPGTIITRLKTVTNISVHYRIISGNEDIPTFSVDGQGQLMLTRPLDRESHDVHIIAVLAETDSSPPLTALAEVTLKVLDENDHIPEFESNPYKLTLAENVEEGTSILKVVAHDKDIGSNGEVRYSFGSDIGDLANVFAVDAYTGWITTLVQLDKEKQSEYVFQIVATDNGTPKHFTRTNVYIKLQDYNDNPPVFGSRHYEAAVNEDALPGTVVVQLSTEDKDADLSTSVDFYITSGDARSQFQIRQTGEVYVAKPLDRETVSSYVLDVTATDGKYIAKTKVTVDILDANDNPPYCLRYRYHEILSEGVHPGSYVLTVLATDIDEEPNANLRYYLTGDGSDKFSLDKAGGHLKTAQPLDREEQSKFQLTAHVQDRDHPDWQCSSQLEIIISDLNDNSPEFSMESYSATLPEDVEVGSLVTKVHATDRDIGINRKIRYSFVDSADGHFKIASDSGIVTLAKPLDRETRAMYNLSVRATDQGTPQLSKVVLLNVHVLDINDNPPEFASKYYYAVVPEIDAVGTEIVRVLATSKDTGVNAEITYSIVGGNEHKKFEIHPKTGVITIAEQLDYERAKDYFLTIQAIDGGVPPLSNHATVNISVLDSNDNAPIFSQASFSARIREDAQIGDKILQVTASDLDSGDNGKISYFIERGDRHRQFFIDEKTGYISVAAPLDREMISSYVLEVNAKDNGLPVMTSYVMVNVEISDANDNPPVFSQPNYTAVVQEDKPLQYAVIKFLVTDADAAPNAAPYTYDIRSGNEGNMFVLEQDGVLRTAGRFNHKVKDNYLLHVRVFDNGTPPLFSDTWVTIKVIEESQYPPSITPLEVFINSFMDEFPGGTIGQIHASDQDQYDTLSFNLVKTTSNSGVQNPTSQLFEIEHNNGTLVALPGLDVGDYHINVSVTDGKFTSYATVRVSVDLVSEEMLSNAVIVRFRNVSPLEFVLSHRRGFVRAVRNALSARLKDVVIISVQPSDETASKRRRITRHTNPSSDLDVLFAVRKSQPMSPVTGFHSSNTIRKAITDHLEELESSANLVVEEIVRDKCVANFCTYGECEDQIILDASNLTPISTDVTSFVSPHHQHKVHCNCKEGYSGDRCETVINECARDPCPMFKVCIPDASLQGYSCQCPEGFAGTTCEIDISKCHDESCYIPRNPVSFGGKSYAQYKIGKNLIKKTLEDQLSLSLRIRTVQPTGNLMYAAGKIDYNILEVVNGVVQYRFDLGSGEGLVRVSSVYVSDGLWHEVKLEREKNSAQVIVDGKHIAHGSAPGANDILNLQSDDLYLGAEVRHHPTILGYDDVQRGFIGCMDDVRISHVSVPLHMSGASSVAILKRFANVDFSCDALKVLTPPGVCGSQPCMNGGTCKDLGGDNYECLCYEKRFAGHSCEIDTDPCASSPCLYGGRCRTAPAGNDYLCECPPRLSGKRCEYGHYCSPNPCLNGGVCEEGNSGPICKCLGFTGDFCKLDIDECETAIRGPCLNGGTCYNEPGTYRCVCPPNVTGVHCANPVYGSSISSSIYNITGEELVGIIVAVAILILLVICFIMYRRFRVKRSRERANNINNETRKDIVLNSARPNDNDFKRGSKLSNLEVSQVPPQCPPRPASYTPSSNNDPTSYNHTAVLNNLDTLRSYGSAGDELENVPPDYLRNLNRSTPVPSIPNHTVTTLDAESLHKPSWAEMTDQMSSYTDSNKIKNDLKRSLGTDFPRGLMPTGRPGRGSQTGASSISSIDEDPRIMGGYHWDCSDWVHRSQNPLPNITEVPGSEVPDSSSFHSNESNESNTHQGNLILTTAVNGPVDPVRDIETLNEDQESEYIGDSECGTEFEESQYPDSPSLNINNILDNSREEYSFKRPNTYLCHPNTYLPRYNINSETETEPLNGCNNADDTDDEEVVPYGFPTSKRRKGDDEDGSVITVLGERASLLGGFTSNSDISTHLCEIEDSEFESLDHKKNNQKKSIPSGVMQTSV